MICYGRGGDCLIVLVFGATWVSHLVCVIYCCNINKLYSLIRYYVFVSILIDIMTKTIKHVKFKLVHFQLTSDCHITFTIVTLM